MKKRYRALRIQNTAVAERLIYREDDARQKLTPEEFSVYSNLHVEDQVTVAHLLLTALQVEKAKSLLKNFARESVRLVKSVRGSKQLRLIKLVNITPHAHPGTFLSWD